MIGREQMKKLLRREEVYAVSGTNVMIAVLTLKSGFVVLGQSGVVNDNEFSEAKGNRLALNDAYAKLAEHEAYLALDDMSPDEPLPDVDEAAVDAHLAFTTDFGGTPSEPGMDAKYTKSFESEVACKIFGCEKGDHDGFEHTSWFNWKLRD